MTGRANGKSDGRDTRMNRRTPLAAGLALMAIALGQPPAAAAEELPIFDTHMHYSRVSLPKKKVVAALHLTC